MKMMLTYNPKPFSGVPQSVFLLVTTISNNTVFTQSPSQDTVQAPETETCLRMILEPVTTSLSPQTTLPWCSILLIQTNLKTKVQSFTEIVLWQPCLPPFAIM